MTIEDIPNAYDAGFATGEDEDVIIKVLGVGGGGNNAVNHMYREGIKSVSFVNINTDRQALRNSAVPNTLEIGDGLGAGNKPEKASAFAEDSAEEIAALFDDDTKMVFITAGMGGGTGTGAAPVVAKIAKDMGILTVGVVTKPFGFEAKKRMTNALAGIEKLKEHVDTIIIIPNDKLLEIVDRRTTMPEALKKADEVLQQAVQGITDLINMPAIINLDFADVQTVMKDKGIAHIGIGTGKGDDKAAEAAKMAVESPLLETTITGATHVIINVSGDISLADASDASDYVRALTGDEVNIIFGAMYDSSMTDTCNVTIIATGIEEKAGRQGAGLGFKSGYITPTSLQGKSTVGTGAGLSAFAAANMGLKQPVTAQGGQNRTQAGLKPIGIQKTNDIKSSVEEKSLDIPSFLRK